MPKGKDLPLGYAYRDVSFDQEPNQRKENQRKENLLVAPSLICHLNLEKLPIPSVVFIV